MKRNVYSQPQCELIELRPEQMIAVSEGGLEPGGPSDWGWPDGEFNI